MPLSSAPDGVPSARGRSFWGGLFAAPEFYRERTDAPPGRFESIFEPVVLLLAITLFGNGVLQFGLAVSPSWPVEGLLPLMVLVAAGAYFYSRRLARGVIIWREWLVLLLPVLLVTRFLPYVTGSDPDLIGDLNRWIVSPLSFFDFGFVTRAVLLLATWATSFYSTQDLNDLRVQRGEVSEMPARTIYERGWESDRLRTIDHTTPLRRLTGRFAQGGIALILLSALTASNVQQLLTVEAVGELVTLGRPSSSLALLNVVLYFVAMLVLVAEAQFVRNRTLWTVDDVRIAPGIGRRWAATAIVLVAAGLLAAMLVPSEGLLGLADLVHFGLALLFYLASYVMAGLFLLIWIVTYPLRWLFGGDTQDSEPVAPFTPPALAAPVDTGGSILDVLKSVLFWAVMLGVFGYSMWAIARTGRVGRLLLGLSSAVERASAAIAAWLAQLVRFFFGTAQRAVRAMRDLIPAGLGGRSGVRPRLRLDGLLPGRDPRRIVIATYALVAARAARQGLERRVGQTATEYRARLRDAVPDAAREVDDLTEAFLVARYSRRPIEDGQAALARRCWNAIRSRLRRQPKAE